ncbi:tyrosine-protein phosphatase [Litoribacillus peritrichatus]|uniref:protein-tyrosine-phosphatase n=1 Tax=Litoribacillus peritrichatus TaxID=718191 RepID=A0ABP7M5G7_9GAMM
MIDLHCHLLPGIDDGPSNLEESLALAQQMVQSGVTHAVLTPHVHPGRWDNTKSTIEPHVIEYKKALADASIPLTVGFAGEVRISPDILNAFMEGELPFLGELNGQKVLLLELPHSNIPLGTDKIISWLLSKNIRVMIAHPERNKDVMRRYEKLAPLVDLGCLFQVTAGSLIGNFGEQAELISIRMLEAGLITILASDAHHVVRRPCNLDQGFAKASEVVGGNEALNLVKGMPLEISASQFTV